MTTAGAYVDRLATYLPDGTPGLADLRGAATQLDQAVAAGDATIDTAQAQFAGAFEAIRQVLKEALLEAVPLEEIRSQVGELTAARSLRLEASLGPLHVTAHSPTVALTDPRPGKPPLTLGPLPPDAFTARLDAGPIRGGGTLVHLDDGLSGVLSADLGIAEVAVLASLRRLGGGASFLAVMSAGFTPGLQVGFGFQVNRIGGLVGIERRLDADALSHRLRDGSAAAVLFPLDVGDSGRATLTAAEQLFPPAAGSVVAGPTFRFAWLEVAGQGFASVDLGVLLELPGPRKVALVGVLKAGIDPVVKLRADFAGVLDFAQQRATVDATLIDSEVLGIFSIYGDLAFATSWGPTSYTVLSLGGFYPGFNPEPAQIRPLKRLGMAPNVPLPGMRMRAEGYLAATSNTLQLGGHLEVGVDAGIASISGFVGVDALVQFTPFHIHAQLAAGLDVRFLGQTFCGVSFHGTLDGPGPVVLSGRLTVETFFKDFDFDKTFVFGQPRPPERIPPTRALDLVRTEGALPANLAGSDGVDRLVVLAPVDRSGPYAVVAPPRGLRWVQHVSPLETPVDRVGGVPTGSLQTVTARAGVPALTGSRVLDRFAPGSFITLTAAESLNGPTYEDLPAGLEVGGPPLSGAASPRLVDVSAFVKVRGADLQAHPAQGSYTFPAALIAMVAERDRPAAVASQQVAVTRTPGSWATTAGSTHASATQAMATAKLEAARPGAKRVVSLPAADLARPVALEGV